ncbi:MAG: 3-phosphoshikimate 1-carboxyvinyltransferase [Phycisphaerae bacterium]|nr:3-phosphoshikimate 1-carboxyvinyltransferase [Phycisphaerae bacterium]NUQ47041.1 3-phosphoshikimate 1-carboxyvinyltransferase [Phycisphaerae bacterium]
MQPRPDVLELPRIAGPLNARIHLPGSKSIAQRALLLAALADGRSTLHNLSDADDARRMIDCLQRLGVAMPPWPGSESTQSLPDDFAPPRSLTLSGCSGHWRADEADLHAGESGAVARFIAAAACLGTGRYRVDGLPGLRARPMQGLTDALAELGAMIGFDDAPGRLPLTIMAHGLRGGLVVLSAPDSSQFVSALLMVAPFARQDVFIAVEGPLRSRPYVDMTLRLMDSFGVSAVVDANRFIVPAAQRYVAQTLTIEPDASAAACFFALAALSGGTIATPGLTRDSLQGDIRMIDHLAAMGCTVSSEADALAVTGPVGGRLRGIDVDLSDTPDLTPVLAMLAVFADGPSRFCGVPHLRLKESNRLDSIAHGVRQFGGAVDVEDDGLVVRPAARPAGAIIDTFDDHRLAMAFALASARLDGVVIRNPTCVAKSFPGYWSALRSCADSGRSAAHS